MTHKASRYTYRVMWSAEDEEHVGLCAELPSLSWLDSSPARALRGIQRLVGEVLEDLEVSGELIPEPFGEREYSGQLRVRLTPHLHRRLAIDAAEQGVSLNRLINA